MTTCSGSKNHASGRTTAAQCAMFDSQVAFQFVPDRANSLLLVVAISWRPAQSISATSIPRGRVAQLSGARLLAWRPFMTFEWRTMKSRKWHRTCLLQSLMAHTLSISIQIAIQFGTTSSPIVHDSTMGIFNSMTVRVLVGN